MTSHGPVLDYSSDGDEPTYKIGTLVYTKVGLLNLFVWMLWGNVVFTLVEAIFPQSMQLQLYRLNVSPGWIGVLMTTMTQAINMVMVVPVGFISDRTRTRWGRRIPFILGSMPLVFLSLAALGFTDDIGRALNHAGWPARLHLSTATAVLLIVGTMITTFDISNVFVNSMFDYLVADVVPQQVLSRYMGATRMAGQLASSFFWFFIFRYVETHTRMVYVGAAILYLVGFGMMCFNVREGQYPPVHDYQKREPLIDIVITFLRECFTHPLYISLYISTGLWSASYACNAYRMIFYTKTANFTLTDIGVVKGWSGIASLLLAYPIGWLIDKIHPMRGLILSILLTTPFTFASFYMPNFTWFTVIAIATLPTDIMFDCSDGPLRMHIFPRAQYGQFASASTLLRSATVLIASGFGGWFMQHMIDKHGQRGFAYCFLWQGTFSCLTLLSLMFVFYFWKKYGDTSGRNAEDLVATAEISS